MAVTDFLDDDIPSVDDLNEASARGARESYYGFGNNALPAPKTKAAPKTKPYDPLNHPDYKAAVSRRKIAHDNEMYAHQALRDFDQGEGSALKWQMAKQPKDPNALPGDPAKPGVPMAKGALQSDLLNTLNNAPGSPANVQATRQMQLLAEKRQRIVDEAERTAKARVAFDDQTFLPLREHLLSQPPPGATPAAKTYAPDDYQAPDALSPLNDRIAKINEGLRSRGQAPLAPGSVSAGNFTERWVPLSTRDQPAQTPTLPPPAIGSSAGTEDTRPDPRDVAPDDVLDPAALRLDHDKMASQLKGYQVTPKPSDPFADRVPEESTQAPFKGLAQGAVKGLGALAKGVEALSYDMPPADEFGRPTNPEAYADYSRRMLQPAGAKFNEIKSGSAYQFGKALQDAAEEVYPLTEREKAGGLTKAGEMAGGFLPLLATGPAAPATIGIQTVGENLEADYDQQIAQGKSHDEAAQSAINRSLANGATQAALFEILPKPLRSLGDKFVAKFGQSALSRFLAGRVAQAGEGATIGAASRLADNVASDKPLAEDVGSSAAGMSAIQALLPRGAAQPKDIARAPAVEPPPESAPVAPAGPALEVGGRTYTKSEQGWVRDDGTPVDNPTTAQLLDTNLLAKTENETPVAPEATPAPEAPPAEVPPAEAPPAEPAPTLDPARFGALDENGWALERETGQYFNPQENLWHNPETGETLPSENSTEPTGATNEHAEREPIEPSGSQPSADGPVPDQGAGDPDLGEPTVGALQSREVRSDQNGGGIEPRGVQVEAREPSDAGRGIDADGRGENPERPGGDAERGTVRGQPDEGQPAEVIGRDAEPVTGGQSLSGSATGAPSEFTYRETAAGESPEEHASDLTAFQAAENTDRAARGEAPVTLTPQTLIGGKLGAELGIPAGEAGTAEAAKVHDALEKLTGKKIVFVKGSEKLGWEAATLPGKPNTILVNTEAARPFASLTGHEIGHHIKNQRPDLYKPFADAVTKALPIPEAYRARRLKQGYTEDKLSDEWVNDQLGKHFNDPKFWERMRDNTTPSVFRQIVEAVRDHLGNLGEKIKGLLGGKLSDPLARDFAKMRGTAADMLRRYTSDGRARPAAKPAGIKAATSSVFGESTDAGIHEGAPEKSPLQGALLSPDEFETNAGIDAAERLFSSVGASNGRIREGYRNEQRPATPERDVGDLMKRGLNLRKAHEMQIKLAIASKNPVNARAVEQYGIELPSGYEKSGDVYVSGNTKAVAGQLEFAKADKAFEDDGDPTGIKNEAVDAALKEMGLSPAEHGAGLTFKKAALKAAKIVKADASAGANLINELEAKVRAPKPEENLVLDHELVKLRNSVKAAYGKLDEASASESGDHEAARLRLDAAQEAYQRAADVVTKAGTESSHSLNFRKAMLKEDFSLAELTRREMATQPRGKALSDTQHTELADLAKKYEEASKAYEAHIKMVEAENSKYAVDKAIHEMVLAEERRQATRKAAPERELEILNQEADAAEARLAAKMAARRAAQAPKEPGLQFAKEGEPEANIYDNPEDLRDLAIAAARAKSKRLNVADELVKRFGPEVTPLLPKILAASETARAAMKHRAVTEQLPKKTPAAKPTKPGTVVALKERLAEPETMEPEELSRYARKLAEQHIAAGVRGRENVAKAVHDSLKEALPEMTRREVHDAISMYGQFKPLNKDAIKAHLRDVAGQLQNVSKLEDMARGRAPSKTGVERRTPSDEERRLIKLVESEKKKGGYTVTDPAKQLKSAIDARQTRLKNQIKDLDFQIKTGRKIIHKNIALPVDKEAATLIKRRDELKKQYDALFPKPGRTDAQRIEASMKNIEQEIASVSSDINSGAYLTRVKSPKAPTNLALEAKRAQLVSLRAQRDALRRLAKPDPTPEEVDARNLAHHKAHLLNRIAEGNARLAADDVGPRTRAPKEIKLDDDAHKLRAENERVKKQINERFRAKEDAARPGWVKALDFGARFVRGAVLSSPVTFAKLMAATVQQGLIHPMDEMAGSIIKHAVPKIAAKAQIEGSGFSAKQTVRSVARGIMDGWRDAKDTLSKKKGNQSDLDATYGRGGHAAGALEFAGLLHGAEKAFLKRGMFTYAMEKQVQYAMDRGLDYKDPAVQMRMGVEAYKYANRKIFQEDNIVSDMFKAQMQKLSAKDAVTERVSPGRMLAHSGLRAALPVAKVGTNVVLQTFGRAFGAAHGLGEVAGAYARGMENLKPAEADMIMRHLKQGSVGGAIALAGFFLPHIFGGQYEEGEKRKPNDIKAGEIKGGVKLPKWVSPSGNIPEYLLHNPAIQAAQFGSSIGRIANSPERRGALEAKGLGEGVLAATLGLAEETPYFKELVDSTKAFKPDQRIHWLGGFAQSAVPQAVQFTARKMDQNAAGETNKRQPTTILEHVKQGIPGLREQVPLKTYVDPVIDRKLGDSGLTIPAPTRPRVGQKGKDRAATDAEFIRFKQTFGAEMNDLLKKNLQLILTEAPDRAEKRIQMLSGHAHVKARAELELAARRRAAGTP